MAPISKQFEAEKYDKVAELLQLKQVVCEKCDV